MADIITTKQTTKNTGDYFLSLYGDLQTSGVEVRVDKSTPVSSVKSIHWSINSTGHCILMWKGITAPQDEFIAIISGNGRLDFGNFNKLVKPATSTGEIILTNRGLVANDSYSIYISGTE